MDDKGRFIIPGEFRKDGKSFIGETFEQTKVLEETDDPYAGEGNRHERRKAAALDAKLRKMADLEAEIADRSAF